MPTSIVTTNQTTTQSLNTHDVWALLDGASLTTLRSKAIVTTGPTVSNIDLHIAGDIVAEFSAVDLRSESIGDGTGSGLHDINVSETGSVVSLTYDAISLKGVNNILTNYGTITALTSDSMAVFNFGDEFSLNNHGTITGGRGVFLSASLGSPTSYVNNSGHIQGETRAIVNFTQLILENSGSIIASANDGTSIGIESRNDIAAGDFTGSEINNTGVISGQSASVVFYGKDNLLINSGQLFGDAIFADGNDTFDGRGGTIDGTVFGGDGNDVYIVDDSFANLSENISEGTDTVQSSVGWKLGDNFEDLTLIGQDNAHGIGNELANVITGNDADNRLRGRAANDVLEGGDGNDEMRGGKGNDILLGGMGDDILRGNTGRDILDGGDGHDRLISGKGRDVMTGGEDEDVFVFNRLNHSAPGLEADKVRDFAAGVDQIDFSGLNMGLSFIGTEAFTNTAGEVRLRVTATKTSVRVDADGDGVADLRVELSGASGLEASDFIL